MARSQRGRATGTARPNTASGSRAIAPTLERQPSRLTDPTPARLTAFGWQRLDAILLAAVLVAGLGLYLIRLGAPNGYSFDEIYHAFTSAQLAAGNADAYLWDTRVPPGSPPNAAYEWTHPPGSKLFMQAGIHLLGNTPSGWRLFGAFFGAAGVGLLFVLGRLMFNRWAGLLAALLLGLDGLWFVQARTAMNDVYVGTFLILTYLFFFLYLRGPAAQRRRYIWLIGVALGLAAASKWSASYSFAMIGVLVGLREAHEELVGREGWLRWLAGIAAFFALWTLVFLSQGLTLAWSVVWAGLLTIAALAVLEAILALAGLRRGWPGPATTWFGAFVLIPLALYLGAYLQFFTMGHTPGQLVELQQQMYYYHTHLKATHAWASRWWTWPLVLKPVWYYAGSGPNGTVTEVYALANPLIWWGFLPATVYVLWRWFKAGNPLTGLGRLRMRPDSVFAIYDWATDRPGAIGLSLVLVGFFGQWLPWALSPRISFMYHMLPSVPFGCLAIAYALDKLRRPRLVILAYILPVALAFAFFYPIYSALPISPSYLNQHFWMDSWKPH